MALVPCRQFPLKTCFFSYLPPAKCPLNGHSSPTQLSEPGSPVTAALGRGIGRARGPIFQCPHKSQVRWLESSGHGHHSLGDSQGTHRALLAFQQQARRYPLVLGLDVRRYFYSVDRDVLAGLLFRHLPEPRLQALIQRILDSGAGLYDPPAVRRWLGLPLLGRLAHRQPDQPVVGQPNPRWPRSFRPARAARAGQAARRGLRLKDPNAQPCSTRRTVSWLGHGISREEIRLGAKARRRMKRRIGERLHDPDALETTLRSYAAAFRFGERSGVRGEEG